MRGKTPHIPFLRGFLTPFCEKKFAFLIFESYICIDKQLLNPKTIRIMKKMWMIAAVACAALMVACGGEQKPAEAPAAEAPAVEAVETPAEAPAAEAAPAEAAPAAEAAK